MKFLFITDQHSIGNLEQKIIREYGTTHSLRLMGDFSPSTMDEFGENTLIKKLRSKYTGYMKKIYSNVPEEWPVQKKMEIDTRVIKKLDEDTFYEEAVCFYGGGAIANLSRKYFVDNFSKNTTICLSGNEPIMDSIQNDIYNIIKEKKNISSNNVMSFILDDIKEKQPLMYNIIHKQFTDCGISREKVDNFILKELSIKNYDGKIPTSSSIFKKHPYLERFKFKDNIYWEKEDNSIMIHVPFFNDDEERYKSVQIIRTNLSDFLQDKKEDIIIAYHGNPMPKSMENSGAKKRTDYNLAVIQEVTDVIFSKSKTKKNPIMLCGHLHCSNKPYFWELENKSIKIYPIATDEIVILDTSNGKINLKKF